MMDMIIQLHHARLSHALKPDPKIELRVACWRCGRTTILNAERLALRYQPDTPIETLADKLVCLQCGQRPGRFEIIQLWYDRQKDGSPEPEITTPAWIKVRPPEDGAGEG